MLRLILLFLFLILPAACQSLRGDDLPATMRVDLDAYGTEAAQIQSGVVAQRTQAAATIQAAGTQAADYYHYNNVLIATVRAVIPPTPVEKIPVQIQSAGAHDLSPVDASGMVVAGSNASTGGEGSMTQLSNVAIASAVNPNDSCPVSTSSQFNASLIDTLYLTLRAASIEQGTRLEAVWEYNGANMYTQPWVVPATQTNICIWLSATTQDMVFQTGAWTAILLVNDVELTRVPFELVSG